jgi:hypothetical protein
MFLTSTTTSHSFSPREITCHWRCDSTAQTVSAAPRTAQRCKRKSLLPSHCQQQRAVAQCNTQHRVARAAQRCKQKSCRPSHSEQKLVQPGVQRSVAMQRSAVDTASSCSLCSHRSDCQAAHCLCLWCLCAEGAPRRAVFAF